MINYKESKYKSIFHFFRKKFARFFLRSVLRLLVRWGPLADPEPGYTMVIACNINLKEIVLVLLALISRQDRTSLKELMIAFEVTERQLDPAFRRGVLERFPDLPITFLTYGPLQSLVARAIDWPWVYSWLSWSKAISRARTRYVLLHDFDALPIRPDFFEGRYHLARELGVEYLGVSYYHYNGLLDEDGTTTTWEMMLDAQFVRARFRPIDLFNHVGRQKDRLVEFDTTIKAQVTAGTTAVVPVAEPDDLAHLGQVISQHTQLMNGRQHRADNILFIPYLMDLSGVSGWMAETASELRRGTWPTIEYLGKTLDLSPLQQDRVEWMIDLSDCAERTLFGATRPEVREYFDLIQAFLDQSMAVVSKTS